MACRWLVSAGVVLVLAACSSGSTSHDRQACADLAGLARGTATGSVSTLSRDGTDPDVSASLRKDLRGMLTGSAVASSNDFEDARDVCNRKGYRVPQDG